MKIFKLIFAFAMIIPPVALADPAHETCEICKVECPEAKTDDEIHKCQEKISKKKKNAERREDRLLRRNHNHEKDKAEDSHKH